MKTARAENRMFRVFPKLKVPNGTAYWKIEGWPNGKRKRYYFITEAEASKMKLQPLPSFRHDTSL
jgi:hypothetical protein